MLLVEYKIWKFSIIYILTEKYWSSSSESRSGSFGSRRNREQSDSESEDEIFIPEKKTKWSLFRTKLCRNMFENELSKGDSCFYAHSWKEIRKKNDPISLRTKRDVEIGKEERVIRVGIYSYWKKKNLIT